MTLVPYETEEVALALAGKPADVIAQAQEAARELMKVVESQNLATQIGPKKHLQFEAWQTVGRFYGVTAKIARTEDIYESEKWSGCRAHAEVLYRGDVVGAASSMCTTDEERWSGRPRFQVESMAQTRAMAKALRSVLAWVVVLAGYAATPAEEMSGEDRPTRQAQRPQRPVPVQQNTGVWGQLKEIAGLLKWSDQTLNAWLKDNDFRDGSIIKEASVASLQGIYEAELGKLKETQDEVKEGNDRADQAGMPF